MRLLKALFKKNSMNKSLIVLGGAGFLGKNLLLNLKNNKNFKIGCGDMQDPEIKDVEFHKLNILDSSSLANLSNYDIVINLTGQITKPIESCLLQNSVGILNVVNSVSENCHLIQMSTINVYGSTSLAIEEQILNPETPYSALKAIAETIIKNSLKDRYTILRLTNLYGPGQLKGIMAYLLTSFKTDQKLEFEHNGKMIRSFLHVDDCVKMINKILFLKKLPIGIYNLANNDIYSVYELIETIENMKRFKYKISWGRQKSLENVQKISVAKLKAIISINFENSLEEYIRRTFC
jgi:nucleoside-diphosphate-sugar epimerase